MKVFVLNMRGRPLMPCSPAKARHLLKAGKAVVRRRTPFTIQLRIATGETKQNVTLGVDAGAKHVGLSAATEKEEVFAPEVELRQDITGLLAARLSLRRERRQRKTRYRAPRFLNRVRSKHNGWLPPSVENRIQVRKHNRQIHKCTVLSKTLKGGTKIGYRKLNQSPYLVHGFRLFDKVRCLGQIGFIFGRRSSGYFDVRRLDGVKLSPSISWRKLTLLEKRSTYLTELRKQDGASSPV